MISKSQTKIEESKKGKLIRSPDFRDIFFNQLIENGYEFSMRNKDTNYTDYSEKIKKGHMDLGAIDIW